jgi:tRNA threonylcarbamoyladenosine biosynthesis protein TsaB
MLLALDTSTHLASLAICEHGELRAEYTWDVGTSHSIELLQRLEWFVKERGITLHQLSAVATATGPGSFTGIRVAVTVAKTLAFSLNVPLIGISALDIIAYSHATAALPVCAVMEAGRGEFYAALYQQVVIDEAPAAVRGTKPSLEDGAWAARTLPVGGAARQESLYWQRQGEYRVVNAEELAQEITQPTLFCGDLSAGGQRKLAGVLGPLALFVSPLACVRRAGLLAELAAQRLERGESDDPLTLEPLYVRRPHITVSSRQRPQVLGPHEGSGLLPVEHSTGTTRPGTRTGGESQHHNDHQTLLERQQVRDARERGATRGERRADSEKREDCQMRLASDDEPDQPGWLYRVAPT